MEPYIKEIFSDITYLSELTLDTNAMTFHFESYVSRVNSPKQLTFTNVSVSCGLIKNDRASR